jgi:tellurium resistance protein TerD
MSVPLRRGVNVEFTREVPGLRRVVLGVRLNAGAENVLLDNTVLATLLCDSRDKVLGPEHFVFFNQLSTPDESVRERQQALGGDTEQIEVDLIQVPAEVASIVLIAYVNDGLAAKRTFGQLKNCTVRLLDGSSNSELLVSEDLAPGFTTETGAVLAELYRKGKEWRFKVVGDGYANGIRGIATDYGLPL